MLPFLVVAMMVATHLLSDPNQYLTPVGSFLRKPSLDELPIPDKVKLDVDYLNNQSFWLDLKIIFLTFLKVLRRDGIQH